MNKDLDAQVQPKNPTVAETVQPAAQKLQSDGSTPPTEQIEAMA